MPGQPIGRQRGSGPRNAGSAPAPAAPPPSKDEYPKLCIQCFPGGWPTLVVAASCEHGHYSREEYTAD